MDRLVLEYVMEKAMRKINATQELVEQLQNNDYQKSKRILHRLKATDSNLTVRDEEGAVREMCNSLMEGFTQVYASEEKLGDSELCYLGCADKCHYYADTQMLHNAFGTFFHV